MCQPYIESATALSDRNTKTSILKVFSKHDFTVVSVKEAKLAK